MKFSKRAIQLSGSATMAATLKAQELIQQGHDIVLATIGEPDLDVDFEVKQALINQVQSHPSRYGSSQGLLSTRQALTLWFKKNYGVHYSAKQIIITPGSKFGLFALMQILCEHEDEVIIPAPYWVSYITLAEMSQATVRICEPSENYKITAASLKKVLNEKSRLLILNSPNNPSGAVYTHEELFNLYQVLKKYPQVTVICDDIYNQLIFNSSLRAPSFLDIDDEEFKKQIIIVHGASKSYAMTGWRLGWIASSNSECITKLAAFFSQALTCIPDFIQIAAEKALNDGDSFVNAFKVKNQNRHTWMQQQLQTIQQIKVYPSEGAFYVWIKLLDHSTSSQEITDKLLTQHGLAVVAGEAFGMPYHLRLSVTLSSNDLQKAASRLKDFFNTTGNK